jgi:hypothetical protein
MIFDRKRKPVTVDDDETAHLVDTNVIRYIAFNKDHEKLLKDKWLEPETGITYKLYEPKPVDENVVDQQGGAIDDGDQPKVEMPKEEVLNKIYIPEVVRQEGMKFFNVPKLGCYLAIDLAYQSSLTTTSLQSAIDLIAEYEIKKAEQDLRRKEFEDKLEEEKQQREKDRDNEEGGENHQDNIQDEPEKKFEEDPIVLPEFDKVEKKIILALDTLGKDRTFTETEERLIDDYAKLLRKSWELLEKRLLLKDRDLKREMLKLEQAWKESYTMEKLESDEARYIKDYFASEIFNENPITDERQKAIETELCKSKFTIQLFEDEVMKQLFNSFAQYEFIENERIFQHILYFIGVEAAEIHEENTNKLCWKKAKKYWNDSVLEKLRDYNPYGPKGEVSPYAMCNRILLFLETYDKEVLYKYSVALYKLHEFILTSKP